MTTFYLVSINPGRYQMTTEYHKQQIQSTFSLLRWLSAGFMGTVCERGSDQILIQKVEQDLLARLISALYRVQQLPMAGSKTVNSDSLKILAFICTSLNLTSWQDWYQIFIGWLSAGSKTVTHWKKSISFNLFAEAETWSLGRIDIAFLSGGLLLEAERKRK